MTEKKICGAKKRNGEICQARPMSNGRCRLHGGLSTGAPKGNTNAKTHGIYARFFTDDEKEQLEKIDLACVDGELQLCKIKLMRALEAEREQTHANETNKLELIAQTMQAIKDGEVIGRQQVSKSYAKTDFGVIIDRLIARIQSLTQLRLDIINRSMDIELKQIELEKAKVPKEQLKAQPIQVVVDVVDGRKYAETQQKTG